MMIAHAHLFHALSFGVCFCSSFYGTSVCFAKHVNDKAAKWAKAKRPRKSRPSDINRKPIEYAIHSMQKPAEYTISDAAPSSVTKAD